MRNTDLIALLGVVLKKRTGPTDRGQQKVCFTDPIGP